MAKRRKVKKSFFGHAKCFLSPKFFIIGIILAGFSSFAAGYQTVYGTKTGLSGGQTALIPKKAKISPPLAVSQPAAIASATAASSTPELSSPPLTFPLNLSSKIGVYVFSKKTGPCKDYSNNVLSSAFSMKCKTDSALWRGMWTKKVDVAGYKKLRLKASLQVNDYTDYFAECGHKGVNRDDFVDLMILSSNPEPKLDAECNHVVWQDRWASECSINSSDPAVITHCGIPKCSSNRSCDMEMDVSGREAVYLLFSVSDAWAADIEGELSGVEISLTK